jgi:hypothetical protein
MAFGKNANMSRRQGKGLGLEASLVLDTVLLGTS